MTFALISLVKALSPAWRVIRHISAPLNPADLVAIPIRSIPCARGIFEVYIYKILTLSSILGGGTYIIWSNLPGRVSALSIISGLLVAATTITCFKVSIPSISFRSWHKTLSETSVLIDLWVAMASISSKKITLGEHCLALLKISLIAFSESPTYLENNSGPFTARKFSLLSVAMALAIIVLLHPGGPYKRIPLEGSIPNR